MELQLTPARGWKPTGIADPSSLIITTHTRKGMETIFILSPPFFLRITTHTRKGMETSKRSKLSALSNYNSHPQGDGNIKYFRGLVR